MGTPSESRSEAPAETRGEGLSEARDEAPARAEARSDGPRGAAAGEARHVVAVIGGATAGAEVAGRLADEGALVIVLEQNARPYGKIEDGLPRWHVALRKKEYRSIEERLGKPGVHFVPYTRVGRDVGLDELAREWGLSAVVLACGAWRDRPLPVEGAERFDGRGIVYQNPFIIWFNHADEAGYRGPRFEAKDGALVVGGGLASIDVVKVLQLETTRKALAERGIHVSMLELETKGIPKVLAAQGLSWEELGLRGCTLFYRRRVEDMPLMDMPEGADERRAEKVREARRRILEKAMKKYCFGVEPLAKPEELLVEEGRVVGLRFRRTRIEEGRVVPTGETFERRGPYVVSSIGSIPEPLEGVAMKGELFHFIDPDFGRIEGYPNVFSAGNVVTGKGNIVASRKQANRLVEEALERFLGVGEHAGHLEEPDLGSAADADAARTAETVSEHVRAQPPLPAERVEAILARVRDLQAKAGYGGDLHAWLERVTPPDLA